mgnify:CR=1 FL=1
MEAIQIKLVEKGGKLREQSEKHYVSNQGVFYQSHVQTYGWQGWRQNGAQAGSIGQAKRLEAIQIKLTGALAEKYDVYYRVHCQTYGWMGWAKNGDPAGTTGHAKRLEAIQIVLRAKGTGAPSASSQRRMSVVQCHSNYIKLEKQEILLRKRSSIFYA